MAIEDGPSQSTARMADGTLLRTLLWEPAGEPWAQVLIVHGLGEHAGRYANVAGPLTAAGIEVHGYDQRGFGGSAGPRAWVERWSQLHDDLEERLVAVRATRPGLPLVLYGHSLGGLVACGYVLSEVPRPEPDLLVLSSPALDAEFPAWKRAMAATMTRLVPRMRVSNGTLRDGLSRDPAIRDAYARDPLCQTSSTVRFGAEGFAEQVRLRPVIAALETMPMPTFVFHGSSDPIVPVTASEPLGAKGNVTRHVHEGLRHETHHEPEHEDVLTEVVDWIRSQVALLQGVAQAPARTEPAAVG
jgi:alpha-beta hydrolase superfamily lysophospholipase